MLVDTLWSCRVSCLVDLRCNHYSYDTSVNIHLSPGETHENNCFLKYHNGESVILPGFISGEKWCGFRKNCKDIN